MMNKFMNSQIRVFANESGAALMMAIFAVTMLMVIATEIMYETNVEMSVSSQSVNAVKAHYAAQAGVQMSLLRIQIFRKAAAMAGDQIPTSMLDPIWQMPFSWPPILPPDTSAIDKDEVKKSVKQSKMAGTYFSTIEGESGKIDLNDLASPSKVIAEATRHQIDQIFTSRMESDEKFAERFRGFEFQKVINNIVDWIDVDKSSLNGGDESSNYRNMNPDLYPPNAPFKTLEELHMVDGMTDELFEMLAPRVTVYGTKGVNVNYATKEVLMSLSPQITDVRANEIIKHIKDPQQGPFKDEGEFVAFLNGLGVNGDPFREGDVVKVPLLFESEMNFRIRSTGRSGRVQKEITAIVFDFDRVKTRLQEFISTQNAAKTGDDTKGDPGKAPPPPDPKAPKKTIPPPKDPPQIVYWNET
jgi:general secretion pathway protein K